MATIEIPRFWVFRMPCGCIYGAVLADQRFPGIPGGQVIATAEHAWSEFYDGRKRDAAKAQKDGNHVTAEDELPPIDEWTPKTFVDGVCTVHTASPEAVAAHT